MIKHLYEADDAFMKKHLDTTESDKKFSDVINKLLKATGGKYKGWLERVLAEYGDYRFESGWEKAESIMNYSKD